MNEPLTKSRPELFFSGKTYNKHPQWYNEPLRLTEEQRNDPVLVLYEFFQCYHLNETRKLLWSWLIEVMSSPSSISDDPHDRNNQIYFYEKIEELIEAASLITTSAEIGKREIPAKTVDHCDTKEEVLGKPMPLIEYVEIDPFYVLKQVFSPDKFFIVEEIKEWLLIGLSVDSTVYDDAEQRSGLIAFHEHLVALIEALFVITIQRIDNAELKDQLSGIYKLTQLSQSQIANPEKVIVAFFEKLPTNYVTRELDDWYEASISYAGEWSGILICLQQVWDVYRNVQCLIKSAERLLNNKHN